MKTQHLETNTQTIERLTAELNAALSRAEKAEKACAEIRIAIKTGGFFHKFVSVEELRPTVKFLKGLLEVTADFLDDEDGHYTKITQAEKNRLIALIEKSK